MPAIVESLRENHRDFGLLLEAREQELAVFDRAERPDYEILEDIVAYFQDCPARCHHPRVNAIIDKVKARDPAAAGAIDNLAT